MSKKLYPAIAPYPGAKSGYVGQAIAEILPTKDDGIVKYYEVFGGMANILLHKAPHPEEYYNDLNKKLTTLMEVLSDEVMSQQLFNIMLDTTAYYSQSGFDYAQFASKHMLDPNSAFMKEYTDPNTCSYNQLDKVEQAALVWQTLLMSFNGSMRTFTGVRETTTDGINFDVKYDHLKGNEALVLEEQIQMKHDIPARMKNVTIFNKNAFDLIADVKKDSTALMVCDSPYTKKQMASKVIYECEFSDDDQKRYANLVYDSRAKVLVCGYNNNIYNSILLKPNGSHKWYRYTVAQVAKSMSRGPIGQMRSTATEVIWTNWKVI